MLHRHPIPGMEVPSHSSGSANTNPGGSRRPSSHSEAPAPHVRVKSLGRPVSTRAVDNFPPRTKKPPEGHETRVLVAS